MPLALMLGYVVVLAVSTFAQSERFHQPVVPFEMMFAAYGIVSLVYHRKRKHICSGLHCGILALWLYVLLGNGSNLPVAEWLDENIIRRII